MEELITKLAKVYARKYNLKKCGYEFDDIKSIVSEVYVSVCDKFDPEKDAKFETFLSKCANNKIKNILRDEISRPLNSASCFDEGNFVQTTYVIDEWLRVRDLLLLFNGVERLIVKEILDPSEKVSILMKQIVDKHVSRRTSNSRNELERRLSTDKLVFVAIKKVYEIPENTFRMYILGIKNKIKGRNFSIDIY